MHYINPQMEWENGKTSYFCNDSFRFSCNDQFIWNLLRWRNLVVFLGNLLYGQYLELCKLLLHLQNTKGESPFNFSKTLPNLSLSLINYLLFLAYFKLFLMQVKSLYFLKLKKQNFITFFLIFQSVNP